MKTQATNWADAQVEKIKAATRLASRRVAQWKENEVAKTILCRWVAELAGWANLLQEYDAALDSSIRELESDRDLFRQKGFVPFGSVNGRLSSTRDSLERASRKVEEFAQLVEKIDPELVEAIQ